MDARTSAMFRRLAGDHDFQRWLKEQETLEIKALLLQNDMVQIHKTQGRVTVVQKLIASCEVAKTLP